MSDGAFGSNPPERETRVPLLCRRLAPRTAAHLWNADNPLKRFVAPERSAGNIPELLQQSLATRRTPATVLRFARFSFIFATDSCNVEDPINTGLPRMMQNLPFLRRPTFTASMDCEPRNRLPHLRLGALHIQGRNKPLLSKCFARGVLIVARTAEQEQARYRKRSRNGVGRLCRGLAKDPFGDGREIMNYPQGL